MISSKFPASYCGFDNMIVELSLLKSKYEYFLMIYSDEEKKYWNCVFV
jgi:hypothetical protein